MLITLDILTQRRSQMIDLTEKICQAIHQSGIVNGQALVHVPHTTAALTINENADPDVMHDLEGFFSRIAPSGATYRHREGNSDAHIKSSLLGVTLPIIITGGEPLLGTWQGLFFCEFDGPRQRQVHIQVSGS